MEIIIVLSVLVVAFALFVSGKVKPEIIAMLVLVSLVFGGTINAEMAFSGFSSFAVISIAGLMVIGDGLQRTGVVQWVARQLEKIIRRKYSRLIFLNTVIPGVLSGFINIVASAAFFIPVILRLCKQMKVPQSKILLPMACTALIGANLSLIGASHNLVVHSLLERSQGQGFGFFEFTLLGAVLLAVAIVYIFLFGPKLLPGVEQSPEPEKVPLTKNLIEAYGLEDRIFEVWASDIFVDNPRLLGDLRPQRDFQVTPLAVVREAEHLIFPRRDLTVESSDMLLVQGREVDVKRFAEATEGLTFMGTPKGQEKYPLSTGELAEAVVPPRSPAIGKSAREIGLPERFGMTVAALYRKDNPLRRGAVDEKLETGDAILVYGPRSRIREFNPGKELLIYYKPGEPEFEAERKKQAPVAALILLLVVLGAALDLFPIAVTAVTGALLMVIFRIVPLEGVYRAIDWKTLILIGGMYPLGVALNGTGAATLIGQWLVDLLGGFGPMAVLGGISVLCMILTQPIHNAAVAIIMTPIAIDAAVAMDSSPHGFCAAVIVSCACAFLMPYGHPAPFLVQEPGGYRSMDYVRFGIGLNILALVVILSLVPVLWPL